MALKFNTTFTASLRVHGQYDWTSSRGVLSYVLPPVPDPMSDGTTLRDDMNQIFADFNASMQSAIAQFPVQPGDEVTDAFVGAYSSYPDVLGVQSLFFNQISVKARLAFYHLFPMIFTAFGSWGDKQFADVTKQAAPSFKALTGMDKPTLVKAQVTPALVQQLEAHAKKNEDEIKKHKQHILVTLEEGLKVLKKGFAA